MTIFSMWMNLCQGMFLLISMEIGDLIFNHNMHQRCHCSIVADFEQLRQLEVQKSTYTANFQGVEVE